jgi:hypothetical protein
MNFRLSRSQCANPNVAQGSSVARATSAVRRGLGATLRVVRTRTVALHRERAKVYVARRGITVASP